MGTIKTKGYAERKVPADTTEFEITFSEYDIKEEGAIQKCNDECERFLQSLTGIGIKIEDIQLHLDRISKSNYDNQRKITCTKSITFPTICNPKFNSALSQVISKGKRHVELITTNSIENDTEIKKDLLKEAILDSKRKAELIASADGRKIIGIDSVYEDGYADSWKEDDMDIKCGATPEGFLLDQNTLTSNLSVPKIKIQASINISWSIE